jgi:hypothetical protein
VDLNSKDLLFPLHFLTLSIQPSLVDVQSISMATADNVFTDSGFTRPEMYTEKLAGTVDAYDRHVFLYYKNHLSWPPRVEASDDHPLPKLIAATFKARKNDLALKVRFALYFASNQIQSFFLL